MEGVIDPVVRKMMATFSGVDLLVTEFIRVTDKLLPDHVFHKVYPELLQQASVGGVSVIPQLLGGQAEPMAENAHRLTELGAPAIDLNFGCPAKTVNRHDGGASLLQKPERLYNIISTIRRSVSIPISAKVRLGFMDKSLHQEIALAVSEAQARWLTVHARTKIEGYQPPAHWEFIASMKEVSKIPVIANGDIWSIADYLRCRDISGCQDVALGRGMLANPLLALQIKSLYRKSHLSSETLPKMDWSFVQTQWLPQFLDSSKRYKNEHYALTRGKQFIKLLGRGYPEAVSLFENIKTSSNYQAFYKGVGMADETQANMQAELMVEMYVWTYCPFCVRARALLNRKAVAFNEIVLDGNDSELAELRNRTGHRTVPQIFIKGEFIGGFSELSQLDQSGRLDEMLKTQ